MTARSPSLCRKASDRTLAKAVPAALAVLFWIFANPEGPSSQLAKGLGAGVASAACGVFGLFAVFALVHPEGWSPRRSVDEAEVITLWMAALAAASCVF